MQHLDGPFQAFLTARTSTTKPTIYVDPDIKRLFRRRRPHTLPYCVPMTANHTPVERIRRCTALRRRWSPPARQAILKHSTRLNRVSISCFHIRFYLFVTCTATDKRAHKRIATTTNMDILLSGSVKRDDNTTHTDDGKTYSSRTIRRRTDPRRHWPASL